MNGLVEADGGVGPDKGHVKIDFGSVKGAAVTGIMQVWRE